MLIKRKTTFTKRILHVNQPTQRKGTTKYKNKLINILRNAERDHCSKLLRKHQHDIKGTWKVLNSLIKKGRSYKSVPDTFVCGNQSLTDKSEIATGFNDFFVNVGPHLARIVGVSGNSKCN